MHIWCLQSNTDQDGLQTPLTARIVLLTDKTSGPEALDVTHICGLEEKQPYFGEQLRPEWLRAPSVQRQAGAGSMAPSSPGPGRDAAGAMRCEFKNNNNNKEKNPDPCAFSRSHEREKKSPVPVRRGEEGDPVVSTPRVAACLWGFAADEMAAGAAAASYRLTHPASVPLP